jgi:CheY-like chemotaxis protein
MDRPQPRVLVVDDNDAVRRMLAGLLRLDGFDVVGAAPGGAEGVRMLAEHTVDVVVLDLRMPPPDGFATAARMRSEHPGVTIVGYTAALDAEVEVQARAAGVDHVLGKVEGIEALEAEIVRRCAALS